MTLRSAGGRPGVGGQVVELTVVELDRNADARARLEGVDVVVPGLLPRERARAEIVHVGQHGRAFARVLEVTHPSAGRRPAPCPHQATCSGCPLMVATESLQLDIKRAELAALGLAVDEIVSGPDPLHYRWSAKRVVGGVAGAPVFGSYRRGSHDLADMSGCLVDHPDLVACLDELRDAASRLAIEPYDERRREGDLRYAWLKTDGEGHVLLTLVSASSTSRVPELAAALSRPAGVAWSIQAGAGNAMRGEDLRQLRGAPTLTLSLAGAEVRVGPLGFLQPNPRVAERAYRDLVRGLRPVQGGGTAFDLYAGAGVTTHLLRQMYDEVVPCESYPESARALGIEPETAEAFLGRSEEAPRLVVANPPRAGLGDRVASLLNALGWRARGDLALHVMSCEPAALARDLEHLTGDEGAFTLLGVRAYDTLPQTAHVEVVAWLERRA
jgi:23S rRNA (uracil1939-C5)-methyltransferase